MANSPGQNTIPDLSRASRFWEWVKYIWRKAENTLFGLAVFVVSLYFLLQMPSVQNWIVGKVTAYLSEEWETPVAIQKVDIEFFDNLVLEGLYVEDSKGDTLLFAGKIHVGMKYNFFSFFGEKVEFTDIAISNARFNIKRAEGEKRNTLTEFLSKISKPSGNKKKSAGVVINIQNLHLNDVVILRDIETVNKKNHNIIDRERHLIKIPFGLIKINAIDPDNNLVDIRSAHLDGLFIQIQDFEHPATLATDTKPAIPVAKISKVPSPQMIFRVGELLATRSSFIMDRFDASPGRTTLPNVMDYEHLNITDITLQGKNLSFNDEFNSNAFVLNGSISHLAAREQSGFQLTHAEFGQLSLTDTLTSLYNVKIQTENTSLGDTMQFRYSGYRDFRSFEDSVDMDIRISKGSTLRLGDLNHFDDNLAENQIFKSNVNELINLSGHVYGKVNRLRADSMVLELGNSTYINCDFRGNELNKKGEPQTLTFEFKELRTDLRTINRLVPNFSPPEQFYKLGSIKFKGDYQLFDRIDHVLFGEFVSDLGPGQADMHLNLKEGREKAIYSGGLAMNSFDMATWTGDKQFGRTTFRVNIGDNSSGLTLNTIKATVTGMIDTLSYRGYQYRDIYLNGAFEEKVFEGKVKSDDPNIDFTFDGAINLKEEIPSFEFSANIERLDLGVLNLSDKDIVLSGKVDNLSLEGKTLNDITGSAKLRHFRLIQDRELWHRIDSLNFYSTIQPDGARYFGFNSDVAKCELVGRFNFNNILSNLVYQLQQYHPAFAEHLGVVAEQPTIAPNDNYRLSLQIRDSKSLTKLITEDLDTLRDVHITAGVNSIRGTTYLVAEAPVITYRGISITDPGFNWSSAQDSAWFNLKLPKTMLSPKKQLPEISFFGNLVSDELFFTLIASENETSYLENLYLKGSLTTADSLWQLRFNASKINMFSQEWLIADDNFIRFNSGYLDTKNFEFFSGNQRIVLESANEGRGLNFSLTQFNLSELNRFFDPESLVLQSRIFDFDISIRDVFELQGMRLSLLTDTVFVNTKPYGIFSGNLEMEDLSSPLYYSVFLRQDEAPELKVKGAWLPDASQSFFSENLDSDLKSGELFASATLEGFPFEILETFIPDISRTSGFINGNLVISGSPNRVGASGLIDVVAGQFQIDYLNSLFHLKNQQIRITKNRIEVADGVIWDATQEHFAKVDGFLEHDNYSKWRVNCYIEAADRSFTILNTGSADNELYYGQGIGYFDLSITGSFVRTNMLINATTGKDTRLYIPLSSTSDAKEAKFINFANAVVEKEKETKKKSFTFTDLKGLNFEMNLTVTEDAEIQLIFDEQTGDIIKSRGEGDIKLSINREGEFKMYGGYRVIRGEYLFTLLNFVNKPFTMASGGTINWFGDPYGALLNLDATYEQNTAVYNFIRDEVELLTTLKDEATKATKVVVTMHISGDLLKPDITFGLEFPNITSQLKSMTDNKLRLLRQDQNELSRQIFGLVVIGSFLPSNSGFVQPSDYVASAFNTLTQMISNQFSNYLGGLAAEWFNKDVSSIDLDINYSDYQNVLADPGNTLTGGRELQVRLKSGFIDDRITVQVGSQFGLGGGANLPINSGFLGEDVTIEIRLTENNQWRLKVYQRIEPDVAGQRRDRYGVGITFQKDFDSFGDVWEGLGLVRRGK
jgi:TamB, inner membrane protein subunit of TAM complex